MNILPTAIWITIMPPRLRFAKNTLITAYPIIITTNRFTMGFALMAALVTVCKISAAVVPRPLETLILVMSEVNDAYRLILNR